MKNKHTHKIDVCDCFSKFKKTIFLHVLFFKGAVEEVIVENTFWSGVQYSHLAPADPSLADFSAVLSIFLALIFIWNIACHKYTNHQTSSVLSGLLSSLQKIFGDLHFSESFVKERVVNFDKQIHLCGSRSFGCFSITRGRRQGGVVRKSRMDANSRNDT